MYNVGFNKKMSYLIIFSFRSLSPYVFHTLILSRNVNEQNMHVARKRETLFYVSRFLSHTLNLHRMDSITWEILLIKQYFHGLSSSIFFVFQFSFHFIFSS